MLASFFTVRVEVVVEFVLHSIESLSTLHLNEIALLYGPTATPSKFDVSRIKQICPLTTLSPT